MKPSEYLPRHPGDWPEDFDQENGCYVNTCIECGHQFMGYKRRGVCKICMQPNWEELSKKKQPEKGMLPGCWNEGEMVGYARCMINKVRPLIMEIERLKKENDKLQDLRRQDA